MWRTTGRRYGKGPAEDVHDETKTQPVLLAPETEKGEVFDDLGAGRVCYCVGSYGQ